MSIAFDDDTLTADPVWTALDQLYPSLVASYTIDRGRAFELDRVDAGRATVTISDRDGILDPTNPGSPYVGKIQPLKQAVLCRHDPFGGGWHVRFRGFVEEFDYDYDPSQRVNRLELQLVDIFEIVQAVEMFPGQDAGGNWRFGSEPPKDSKGYVYFAPSPPAADPAHTGMQYRVNRVLMQAGIPDAWRVVFSGNVSLMETVYSPGESAMTAIQEAVDAEFPAVGNVYCDRYGRLCVHGRYARFAPVETAATVTPGIWDFQDWFAGDGTAVAASPTTRAHIRSFSLNRGLSKIINRAMATQRGIKDSNVSGQVVQDATSVGKYGIRPWSTENLLLARGETDNLEAKDEAKTYAQYYVDNYKAPQNRVSSIGFRSMHPSATSAQANWTFLCKCDISDRVTLHISSPGGGFIAGDDAVPGGPGSYFIEGIHEEARPLQSGFDDVTLTLDLSPADYYASNPYPPMP